MSLPITARRAFLVGFLATVLLLAIALYFQFREGLEPCPLCISQRLGVLGVSLIMGAASLHGPGPAGIRRYALLGTSASLLGAGLSLRHLYIQHLPPDEVPACGPGLSYMLEYFPLGETLKAMLSGTGDCAKVDWTLLGFSMPFWVLVAFLGLGAWSLAQYWNTGPGRSS